MGKNKLFTGLIAFFFLLSACSNNNNNTATDNSPAPATTPKDLKLERFNFLENVFQNENWLILNGNDSSYLYCSRLGKANFKTYHYKIEKGDSINTIVSEIKLSADTIVWQMPPEQSPVYLSKVSAKEVVWADNKNLDFYVFKKIDSSKINLQLPDGSIKSLVKTITLAAFLVKSKYDYLHGTRLAFETKK